MPKPTTGLVSIPAATFATLMLLVILSTAAGAQTLQVVHNFDVTAGIHHRRRRLQGDPVT
jgi:hypothetical protein